MRRAEAMTVKRKLSRWAQGFLLSAAVISVGGISSLSKAGTKYCVTDFHYQQKRVPHHLSAQQMAELKKLVLSLYSNGSPLDSRHISTPVNDRPDLVGNGWRLLGRWGDQYAKLAANVVDKPLPGESKMFNKIVKNHWLNVVGPEEYRMIFASVARMHFTQYVELLSTGYWPDSDQIINSYLTAARTYGFRNGEVIQTDANTDIVVFDSVWVNSGMNDLASWEGLVGLDPQRIVPHSYICTKTHTVDAVLVVAHDLIDLLF